MTQCISHEDTGLECWRWLSIGQMSYIFFRFFIFYAFSYYSMFSHISSYILLFAFS